MQWWHATPWWAVVVGIAVLFLLANAVCAAGGYVPASTDGGRRAGPWLEQSNAMLGGLMFVALFALIDRGVAAVFATADDRWTHRRAGVAAMAGLLALLADAVIQHDQLVAYGVSWWTPLVATYRVLRVAVHPARSATARARLERERFYSLACAASVFVLVVVYLLVLAPLVGTSRATTDHMPR
ncbi:hypothetical protein AB0B07_16845 [Streptomyces sioyaensis]|uniref:hypothetical protein n=1 Tax=Streptomyces sioyaensis TaxID=67364 RepID=UPI0033CBBEB2